MTLHKSTLRWVQHLSVNTCTMFTVTVPCTTRHAGKSGQWIGSRQSGGQAQKCNPCIATLHLDPSSQSAMHWDPVAGAIDLASLAATPRYQLRHHAPGPSSGFDAMMAAQHAAPATGDERPDKQDSADAAQQAARQDAHASMQPSNQAGGDSFLIHVAYYDTYTSEGWDRLEVGHCTGADVVLHDLLRYCMHACQALVWIRIQLTNSTDQLAECSIGLVLLAGDPSVHNSVSDHIAAVPPPPSSSLLLLTSHACM